MTVSQRILDDYLTAINIQFNTSYLLKNLRYYFCGIEEVLLSQLSHWLLLVISFLIRELPGRNKILFFCLLSLFFFLSFTFCFPSLSHRLSIWGLLFSISMIDLHNKRNRRCEDLGKRTDEKKTVLFVWVCSQKIPNTRTIWKWWVHTKSEPWIPVCKYSGQSCWALLRHFKDELFCFFPFFNYRFICFLILLLPLHI